MSHIQSTALSCPETGNWHPAWRWPSGDERVIEWSEYSCYQRAMMRAQEMLETAFAQAGKNLETENDPADSLEPSVTGIADPADAVKSVREADYFPDDIDAARREEDERLRSVFRDVDYAEIEKRVLAHGGEFEDYCKAGAEPPTLRPGERLRYDIVPGSARAKQIRDGLSLLVRLCHTRSVHAGWWRDPATGQDKGSVAEKLCLIHSEISEAMEGDRKGLRGDKLPHRWMIEVELADAWIRIADLAGALNLDLAGAVMEKLEFNRQRADHKIENRAAAGGKAY